MRIFDYNDGDDVFEGKIFGEELEQPKPCVLVAHAWDGPNSYIDNIAQGLSERGILAFSIDLYGKGVRGDVAGDNSHLMNPLIEQRSLLHQRLLTSFQTASAMSSVDSNNISILGFCFGGLCALDLARLNPMGLQKAISVHGLLGAPTQEQTADTISADVLLLHGWQDPMVTPEDFLNFTKEMDSKKANWTSRIYGKAMHAFTLEAANKPENGIMFDQDAKDDAFRAINEFLELT